MYALSIHLSKDYQVGTIARDQGRESVTLDAPDLTPFFSDLAKDPTQATLQRWFAKKRQPEARVVMTYSGAVIEDAGENIRVRFTQLPVHGVVRQLREIGFKPSESADIYERRSNPNAIFTTQATLKQFYGDAA